MKIPVSVAVAAALSVLPAHSAIEINGIAAKVNGKVITKKEVNFHMAPRTALLQAKDPRRGDTYLKELKGAQDAVLEGLIDNKIVLTELEGKGAQLPDHVIDSEVQRIIREVFHGNEAEFRKSLKETGMTMRAFQESQREKILVQAFRSQQFGDVSPATPAEIEAHYRSRRNDLRDRTKDTLVYQKIFIPTVDANRPGSTPEQNLAFSEAIATQLRNGADFAEHAIQHSADAFAQKGGLWPETSRLDLSPAFAEVLFDAPMNQVTGPLKDPNGFTIVKVLKKNYGPAPSLSEVRDRMRKEVEIEKRSARYKKWISLLKRSAMIERRI